MAEKLSQTYVKGTGDNRKVVLWERHPDHPEGEAFVSNDGTARLVAETATVRRLIGEGLLERSKSEGSSKPALRAATQEEEKSAGLTTKTEKDTAVTPKK